MERRDQEPKSKTWPIGYAIATLGATLASSVVGYATLIEPRSLAVRSLTLALPSLPLEMNGLRLAFLTDFHLGGPGDPLGSAIRAFAELRKRAPDVILLGGDYYDRGTRVPSEPDWSELPAIAPTFAVPGNHDYNLSTTATDEIFSTLSDAGITVLRNQNAGLAVRGERLRVIGLDDPYTERADYTRAVADIEESSEPRIILAHAGLVADELPLGSADLILSGHTHGAQIRVSPFKHTGPLDIFWWLDKFHGNRISPYRQGLFRVQGSLLYTSNGLGTTSLGARFLAPPELTMIELVRGEGDEDLDCDDPRRFVMNAETTRLWPPARKPRH